MYDIPLYKPSITDLEKKLVNEALDTGWISSKGKFVEEFENKFALFVNRKYALTASNGTVALHLALEALELTKGSAVICPSLTYVSTANAIRYAGLIPFFVDCKPTGVMELENIEKGFDYAQKHDIQVSAILPVHLYGNCSNIDEIIKEYHLPIVEDCAESVGSIIENKKSGSHNTEFACFSFFGNKTITTGEGGMVVCNNDALYERCKILRNVGQKPSMPQRYQHLKVGYNYRLTNIASAIGIAQLSRIDEILTKKRNISNWYRDNFKKLEIDDIFLPEPKNCVSNNWLITIIMQNNIEREGLILYLEANNIETRPAFLPIHAMVNLGASYKVSNMSNANAIGSCGINLPSYPELTEDQVYTVCEKIKEFIVKFRNE